MTTRTVQIAGDTLAAMDSNDMSLYITPGSSEPYWASRPNFRDDYVVATPQDFIEAAGYDSLDDSLTDEMFVLDVEV